jgi:antitoxin FitA
VRQILTRVDDDLHARLKRRAVAEGRSMNDLVVEALRRELDATDSPRERLRARLAARGVLVEPTVPPPAGRSREENRDRLIEGLRGSGTALIEGLEWSRGPKG